MAGQTGLADGRADRLGGWPGRPRSPGYPSAHQESQQTRGERDATGVRPQGTRGGRDGIVSIALMQNHGTRTPLKPSHGLRVLSESAKAAPLRLRCSAPRLLSPPLAGVNSATSSFFRRAAPVKAGPLPGWAHQLAHGGAELVAVESPGAVRVQHLKQGARSHTQQRVSDRRSCRTLEVR